MSENQMQDMVEDEEAGIFADSVSSLKQDEDQAAQIDNSAISETVDADKQFITFTIDREEYGTPILTVQEIRGWMKTTPLPNTPEFVVGVTNLRGNIVPVFDLRSRFSGQMTEITERHVVIMVEIEGRTIGLLVDAISDILTVDDTQIQPPPTGNLIVDTQYIDGLFASDERMVALININKLFNSELIHAIDEQTSNQST